MAEEDTASEEAPEASGGSKKLILFDIIGVVLIGIVGGAAFMFLGGDPEEGEEAVAAEPTNGPPIYQSLHPPLVVNFKDEAGDSHYMQITMEVMSREQGVINAVRDNVAAIRNALILHYSNVVYEEVATREGKEQMLADGLAEIEQVMVDTTGEGGVEAVYFTALVIQ